MTQIWDHILSLEHHMSPSSDPRQFWVCNVWPPGWLGKIKRSKTRSKVCNWVENREERVRESYSTEWITIKPEDLEELEADEEKKKKNQDLSSQHRGKEGCESQLESYKARNPGANRNPRTESIEDWREQEIYWKPSCFSFCIQCNSIPDWILLLTSGREEWKSKFTAVSPQSAPHEQEPRAEKRDREGSMIQAQTDYRW